LLSTLRFGWLPRKQLALSTRGQIAVVMGLSILFSHLAVFLVVMTLVANERATRLSDTALSEISLVGQIYDGNQGVIQTASRLGLHMRRVADSERAGCRPAPQQPSVGKDGAEARPAYHVCADSLADGTSILIRTPSGTWLGVLPDSRALSPHRPRLANLALGLLAGVGAPTFFACLWATRRVMAPLRDLATSAERLDAARLGEGLNDFAGPAGGTVEIRQLAEAFRGLIRRLREYADDQRRMVAGVSHDLRTPLTRLRLRLEAVQEPPLRLQLIRDVDNMRMVVDSSLSLLRARETEFTRQDLDLGALLQMLVDDAADGGADVTFDGLLHLRLSCDPTMITRAVENVIDNAVKFAGSARVSLAAHAGLAVIEIEDSGSGIEEALRPHVFKPYFRGDPSRGAGDGNGLGLSIAQAVVEAHGGRLSLHDAIPHGLRVRIELPAAGSGIGGQSSQIETIAHRAA
jgi:signal transduction histidine kinase